MAAGLTLNRIVAALLAAIFMTPLLPAAVFANEPPVVSIRGPRFVPVSSASPRLYLGGSFDHDSASMTRDFECGAQPPLDSGPWYINGHEWFTCSMSTAGTHQVAIRAQDSDGEQSAAVMEVVASTRIRSVADGHLVTTGHAEDRPFGGALAFVDLNGDGKADLASGVGAPRSSPQFEGVRQVHVLFGRSAGGSVDDTQYTGSTGFRISGTAEERRFGTSIANAGDVNGDGYADIIIGSPASEVDNESRAYVVFGRSNISSLSPATMTASQGFRIAAPGLGGGIVVAGGKDINGDGYSDVVVGLPYASFGATGNPGAAYVIYGKANPGNVTLDANPSTYGARLAGSSNGARVGQAVALGDVNGDKKADVILRTSGNLRVVFGRGALSGAVNVDSMTSSVGFTVSDAGIGRHAVAAGDVNGDGRAEIIVATEENNEDRVSIIVGRASPTSFSLLSPPPGQVYEVIPAPGDEGAFALSAADWNGDKKADILIGDRDTDEARGSLYIVPGQASLVDVRLDVLGAWHRVDGDLLGASAGEAVAAGDFNGDKRADIAVGAPWSITEDPNPFSFGRVGVFLGSGVAAGDTTPPVSFAPSPSLTSSTFLTPNPTVRISWPAATDNVGVVRYRLQRRVNAGSWTNVALASPGTLSTDIPIAAGSNQYTFRVRAFDAAGNVSSWKTGPKFRVRTAQENDPSISYTGTFTSQALPGASGGYVASSETAGHTASLTFTGRSVALVTTRGARGKLQITLDGEELPLFDLYHYADQPMWIPVAYNLAFGTHTVSVEVLGETNPASGTDRIDIDAFIVLN